jgi:TorA maturation chaperone TorD
MKGEQMSEEDRELAGLRQTYYGLLVRLFWREPEADWIASLAEGLKERARAAGQLNERMGEGWRRVGEYLDGHNAAEVAEEFTKLFLNPFGAEVNPYESYYLVGNLFKEPLLEVRNFMAQVGLEKRDDEFPEPEDVLAFELEIMRWLIGKELDAEGPDDREGWVVSQAEFLKRHVLIWAPACARDIGAAEDSDFYKGATAILEGFLELERIQFHSIGPEKVETLEEARRRHGGKRSWRGPTFDPGGEDEAPGEPGS